MTLNGIKLPDDEQKKYKDGGLSRCVIRPERFVAKNFWFQGPDEEIIRLLDYLEKTQGSRLTMKKVAEGLSRVWVPPTKDAELFLKFTVLKATGFALELTEAGEIFMADVLYKPSGSGYITRLEQIAAYYTDKEMNALLDDSHSGIGINWPDTQDPCRPFRTWYQNENPRKANDHHRVTISYKFPFQQEWEDGIYIFEANGEFYQFDASSRYVIVDKVLISAEGVQRSVGIPKEVRVIGKGAFKDNKEINRVTLSRLDEIQDEAFAYCSNLKHIEFKKGLKRIGAEAFRDCAKLTELIIPDSVGKIGQDAFFRCGVERLVWPKGVKEIPAGMFKECRNLYEITIPAEVTAIGRRAFNRSNTIIVHGVTGSAAESYAKNNGMFFREIESKN